MKKLGFGFMRLPLINKDDASSVDLNFIINMVDKFMDAGYTYFDTAYGYHNETSEVFFKKSVVDRYERDKFIVADKMPAFLIYKTEDLQEKFDEQIRRTGVEYFDYYLLHALNKGSAKRMEEVGAFDYMVKLKEQGKVKNIGFSFHDSAEVLDEILTNHPEMEFVQLQINYADWESDNVQSRLCYEVARKHNKPIIVMEPIKGGGLANIPDEVEKLYKDYNSNDSVAAWAFRYVTNMDGVFMVLSGMSNMEQIEDNINIFNNMESLNEEESAIIDKAVNIIKNNIKIACTDCKYCVADCPEKINIPEYFKFVNKIEQMKESDWVLKSVYKEMTEKNGFGKASSCIECGECEDICPQKLPIINHLKEVATIFE